MPKIHGILYITTGLFVSAVSWKLNYEKLVFFFYSGLLFTIIGAVKLIFSFIKSKGKNERKIHQKTHGQMQHKYCPQCGAALRMEQRFCGRCVARV